jgi:hypothetical protein
MMGKREKKKKFWAGLWAVLIFGGVEFLKCGGKAMG